MTLEQATAILQAQGYLRSDGSLACGAPWIGFFLGEDSICLDGDFAPDELMAIAVYAAHHAAQPTTTVERTGTFPTLSDVQNSP